MAAEDLMQHAAEATTTAAHESGIHVTLAAEKLGTLWGLTVTNTILMSWIVTLILLVAGFFIGRNLKMMPGKFQAFVETLFTFVQDFVETTLENKVWSRRILPLLLTIFLFLALANLLEFTPGIGSIKFFNGEEHVPLLRSMNTDLNNTLALTVISVIAIELAGILALGFWRYAGKFINFSSPINFVVGIIELISELSRFVSFSFRLFGNIFAGEVLIGVVSYFVPYVLPAPLMGFEMFVGIVQAAVFALLTLFFVKMAIAEPHGQEAH